MFAPLEWLINGMACLNDLSDFSGHRQGAASEAVAAVAFEVEGFGDGVSGSWLAGMCSLYRLEHPLIGFQKPHPQPF